MHVAQQAQQAVRTAASAVYDDELTLYKARFHARWEALIGLILVCISWSAYYWVPIVGLLAIAIAAVANGQFQDSKSLLTDNMCCAPDSAVNFVHTGQYVLMFLGFVATLSGIAAAADFKDSAIRVLAILTCIMSIGLIAFACFYRRYTHKVKHIVLPRQLTLNSSNPAGNVARAAIYAASGGGLEGRTQQQQQQQHSTASADHTRGARNVAAIPVQQHQAIPYNNNANRNSGPSQVSYDDGPTGSEV